MNQDLETMNDQAFAPLEYEELRSLLHRGVQTPMGHKRVQALVPLFNIDDIERSLHAISECLELRARGGAWNFSGMADPTEALALLRIEGSILDPLKLLELARLSQQALDARSAIQAERETCPILWEVVANLPRELHTIAARISSKILPSGELDDRASPELAHIRADISRLRSDIARSLERLMRKSEESVQDQLVTIRNDRFVIPIKSDHRGRVPGVAHGFSSSGATTFIEPLETIEANNELQALREKEEREINKILFTLTEELRYQLGAIEEAVNAIAELDFINAKAVMAKEFNCIEPTINRDGILELNQARHPLLEENLRSTGRSVVPVSFTLDSIHPVMVISGANAGGKTVVLKTTGLLALMALSGLHVPARHASFPLYASILADIGDAQSLAANLSTFTAHLSNISRMIKACQRPALVLLDEVGTGTDPEEGSALGVAIVDYFRRTCGAHVIATTHYSGLKMYAAREEEVINASVEFDEKTLEPTYRLLVGMAGASSGLDIARRFGFPEEIVDEAAKHVSSSSREANDYLLRIKEESETAQSLREALEEERAAVAEKYASLEVEAFKAEKERRAEFERKLREEVDKFDNQSRELLSKIEDRAIKARVEREAERRRAELKREAEAARTRTFISTGGSKPGVKIVRRTEEDDDLIAPQRDIKVGDKVRLRTLGQVGVVDKISDGQVEIRVGSLRLKEKLTNLELIGDANQKKEPTERGDRLKRAASRGTEIHLRASNEEIGAELNLIGHTTDVAVDEVDKFLDEAYVQSLSIIRIIHGHGTGALRRAVSDLLRNHPHVARFSLAPPEQGGAGATIVELKN
jgi:DNA mismatch repair protein MutS2